MYSVRRLSEELTEVAKCLQPKESHPKSIRRVIQPLAWSNAIHLPVDPKPTTNNTLDNHFQNHKTLYTLKLIPITATSSLFSITSFYSRSYMLYYYTIGLPKSHKQDKVINFRALNYYNLASYISERERETIILPCPRKLQNRTIWRIWKNPSDHFGGNSVHADLADSTSLISLLSFFSDSISENQNESQIRCKKPAHQIGLSIKTLFSGRI